MFQVNIFEHSAARICFSSHCFLLYYSEVEIKKKGGDKKDEYYDGPFPTILL